MRVYKCDRCGKYVTLGTRERFFAQADTAMALWTKEALMRRLCKKL